MPWNVFSWARKILTRLDKSLGSGRKKAYLALKAVEQSAGQTSALRDLHGQLGAMEMFLAELKESLAVSSLPTGPSLKAALTSATWKTCG